MGTASHSGSRVFLAINAGPENVRMAQCSKALLWRVFAGYVARGILQVQLPSRFGVAEPVPTGDFATAGDDTSLSDRDVMVLRRKSQYKRGITDFTATNRARVRTARADAQNMSPLRPPQRLGEAYPRAHRRTIRRFDREYAFRRGA